VVSVLQMPRRDEMGPAHYAILGLLAASPRHGYELAPYFAPACELGLVCTIGLPLLYATLHRIEELGYAVAEESFVSQGPPRKVFRLTSSGWQILDEWLRAPVKQVPLIRQEFLLKLFFVRRLPEYDQLELLTVQIQACELMLAEIRAAQAASDPGSFPALVHDSNARVLEATTAWLSEQISGARENHLLKAGKLPEPRRRR
jgi:DNA-binding PadR family transcriptional regulator